MCMTCAPSVSSVHSTQAKTQPKMTTREERVAPCVHKHHTKEHRDDLLQLFQEKDSDHDGHLRLSEVAQVYKELGMFEEDKGLMFKMCPMDSNGQLNWEEFKFMHDKMMSEARKPEKHYGHHSYKEVEGEIRRTPMANEKLQGRKYHNVLHTVPVNWDAMHALFNAFDEDGDDNIDKQQALDLLRVWGTPVDKHALDKEWPKYDSNWDGAVNWNQFKRIFEVLIEKKIVH